MTGVNNIGGDFDINGPDEIVLECGDVLDPTRWIDSESEEPDTKIGEW